MPIIELLHSEEVEAAKVTLTTIHNVALQNHTNGTHDVASPASLHSMSSIPAAALSYSTDVVRHLRRPRAIVLVPSRELALQLLAVCKSLCHTVKFRALAAVSVLTTNKKITEKALEQSPVDILIATPHRLQSLLQEKKSECRSAKHALRWS